MSSFNWRAPPAKKARPDDAGADGANVQGDSGGAARVSGAATRPPADTVHGWALQTHPPAASPLFAGWGVAHIVAVGGAPGGGAPRFASFAAPACGGTPGSAVRPLSSMTPGRVPLTPPVWNRAGDARTPSAADVLRSGTPAGSPKKYRSGLVYRIKNRMLFDEPVAVRVTRRNYGDGWVRAEHVELRNAVSLPAWTRVPQPIRRAMARARCSEQ